MEKALLFKRLKETKGLFTLEQNQTVNYNQYLFQFLIWSSMFENHQKNAWTLQEVPFMVIWAKLVAILCIWLGPRIATNFVRITLNETLCKVQCSFFSDFQTSMNKLEGRNQRAFGLGVQTTPKVRRVLWVYLYLAKYYILQK